MVIRTLRKSVARSERKSSTTEVLSPINNEAVQWDMVVKICFSSFRFVDVAGLFKSEQESGSLKHVLEISLKDVG